MGHIPSADLEAALAGIEDGWYSAADLLPRFNAWAEREQREPVDAKRLGQSLVFRLKPEARSSHGNRKMYRLSDRIVTGRDWFTEQEAR